MKRISKPTRSAVGLAYLASFLLSGILGIGFALLVNQSHHFLADTSSASQEIKGTWQGKFKGQPAVEITISDAGSHLSGTAVFRSVLKTDTGMDLVGDPVAVPIKDPQFDGKTLRFKVTDRSSLSEAGIEMTLLGSNEAELRYLGCRTSSSQAEIVRMVKTA